MKKVLLNFVVIIFIAGLMTTNNCVCEDDPEPDYQIILLQPANGATDVSINAGLKWELRFDPGSAFYEFDVYLDTASPPTVMVDTRLSLPFSSPTLTSGTTYYWKVKGKDYSSGKTVESEIWQFTTGE